MIYGILFLVALVGAVLLHGRIGEACAFLAGVFGMRALRAVRKAQSRRSFVGRKP